MAAEGRVYLCTGSKSTGGFCVRRKGLLDPSKLAADHAGGKPGAFAADVIFFLQLTPGMELIPEVYVGEHSNIGVIGAALGFALMMVLDVALG